MDTISKWNENQVRYDSRTMPGTKQVCYRHHSTICTSHLTIPTHHLNTLTTEYVYMSHVAVKCELSIYHQISQKIWTIDTHSHFLGVKLNPFVLKPALTLFTCRFWAFVFGTFLVFSCLCVSTFPVFSCFCAFPTIHCCLCTVQVLGVLHKRLIEKNETLDSLVIQCHQCDSHQVLAKFADYYSNPTMLHFVGDIRI